MPQTYEEFVQSTVPGIGMASGAPGRATVMSGRQMVDLPEAQASRAYADLQAKREEALKKAYREQADAWIKKSLVDTMASMTEQQVQSQLTRQKVMQAMEEQAQARRFRSLMDQGVSEGKDPRQAYIEASLLTQPASGAAALRASAPEQEASGTGVGEVVIEEIPGTGKGVAQVGGKGRWGLVDTAPKPGSLTDQQKAELDALTQQRKTLDTQILNLDKGISGPFRLTNNIPALLSAQSNRAEIDRRMKSIFSTVSGGPTGAGEGEEPKKPAKATWTREE